MCKHCEDRRKSGEPMDMVTYLALAGLALHFAVENDSDFGEFVNKYSRMALVPDRTTAEIKKDALEAFAVNRDLRAFHERMDQAFSQVLGRKTK